MKKIPKHILIQFDLWVEIIESEGFTTMQKVKGYRDHALKGDRKGQRSSSLSRSWRVIYFINEQTNCITVEVMEVNHHEYKK
ncbi:MAG: type II toxin-antitoxin system mRNA interferase toxin, RelE/StbE family [Bacteriovoracaceae bacterium]|nr:type II toxin-antitoxin system mRNA interferase toxin, RelE/StbE family [Bacteriovoracaceae bacterium]